MKRKPFNHGITQIAWDAAKEEARKAMISVARRKTTIAYSDLAYIKIKSCTLEPHDFRLAHLLGDISTEEDEAGRGMLSAVVVHKTGHQRPGAGFFTLARSLGRDTTDEVQCWVEELQKVHDTWATCVWK